jgi:hypothetical protein
MTNDHDKQNNQPAVEHPSPQDNPSGKPQTQPMEKQENIATKGNTKGDSKDLWSSIGLITAGVGAAFFYLVGWTYFSNWYSFFGISIYQVDVPTHHILVNSVPLIFLPLVSFLLAVIFDHIIAVARKEDQGNEGEMRYNIRRIMVAYLVPILIIIISYIFGRIRNYQFFNMKDVPEELFWFATIIVSTYILILRRGNKNLSTGNDRIIYLILIAICILISSVSIAALDGIADAAAGEQGTWRIPQAYLSSEEDLVILNDYIEDSATSRINKYGPFALIAENDKTIFLTPWREADEEYFKPSPRLFILQRNEKTVVNISIP